MKKLIEEVEGEGLEALMGETVTLICDRYFYTGKLVGVNTHDVLLEAAKIVYDTGDWSSAAWADAQNLGSDLYVRVSAIESYGVLK